MSQEDEMITLAKAAELSGVPARTLSYAAKTRKLRAVLKTTATGTPYYETTLRDVERWKGTYTPRKPVKK